ncbi:MAG: DNA primase [Candidatus Falkowbacteria bacterium]|nr:DNA primase [Candidatus Falkowbacteria bacterium]
MQPSEEIKSKLEIIDVIGEYIKLISAGSNYRALCPFHKEKNPSLMISQDKQIWRCFGCGKGGDIFSFVMEMEGISFVEVLKLLAPKAGVTLQRTDMKLDSERSRILDVLDISSRYYNQILLNSSLAENALKYVRKRGLDNQTIDDWRIGYSPDSWDDLYLFLKKKGFAANDIFAAGMIVKKDNGRGYYNRFRDRVMFPIRNINGGVVAFTARISPEKEVTEKIGKYINSPQTSLYDKSRIIFGLDKAKMAIKNEDLVIVVEGQMDVITAHKNGFKNIVASSGTALTVEQINTLKRYSINIALSFDADSAGRLAAERAIDDAMGADMATSVIEIPQGKDPDDCIKNNPEDWIAAVKNRIPVMEFYFKEYLKGLAVDNINDKRLLAKRILPKIYKIENTIEKDYWLKKLSNIIDVHEDILREALVKLYKPKKIEPSNTLNKKVEPEQRAQVSRDDMLDQSLIGLIIKYPYLIELALNKLSIDSIKSKLSQDLYSSVLIYYNSNIESISNSSDFYKNLRQQLSGLNKNDQVYLLDQFILHVESVYIDLNEKSAKDEVLDIIIFLKRNYLSSEMKKIEKMINEAEQKKNFDEISTLMERFKLLSYEFKSIN